MQIRIGPVVYKVVKVKELADAPGLLHGDINYGRCRIRLSADDDPQLRYVTLWHEALHGILHAAGIEEHDEPTIIALSHGIAQIIKDNPELIAAVAQE
jgi:hypothetical protein